MLEHENLELQERMHVLRKQLATVTTEKEECSKNFEWLGQDMCHCAGAARTTPMVAQANINVRPLSAAWQIFETVPTLIVI